MELLSSNFPLDFSPFWESELGGFPFYKEQNFGFKEKSRLALYPSPVDVLGPSTKLNGYFTTDWSHMWLPFNNVQNQIKVLREPHMKYNVTQLEGKNEPVNFSSSVLGNYYLELEPRNYQAEEANCESDTQSDLLQFSQIDDMDCNVVNLVINIENDTKGRIRR